MACLYALHSPLAFIDRRYLKLSTDDPLMLPATLPLIAQLQGTCNPSRRFCSSAALRAEGHGKPPRSRSPSPHGFDETNPNSLTNPLAVLDLGRRFRLSVESIEPNNDRWGRFE